MEKINIAKNDECFVKEILFEIVLENAFEGELPNGIKVGMNMDEVK